MSEELIAASKARLESLLAPVNGGVGEDVSYDEKFDRLKTETDKLSSLAGETCDWGAIAVVSEELLSERSKDFRIATYLCSAMFRRANLEATLDAFVLLDSLSKTFWDDMYPPLRRVRARAGMVEWMSEQSHQGVLDIKLKSADQPMVKAIDDTSGALDTYFREKFADAYPGMVKLREAVKNLVRTCPKEQPKPVAPPPDAAPSGGPAPPPMVMVASGGGGGPTASTITTAEDARRAISSTGLLLVKMGAVLRAERPEEELAYRFGRLGAWMELNQSPAIMDGNKTLVPPPPTHLKQRFDSLAQSSDWLALLNEADDCSTELILWLDPQRYVSTAMSALGALFMKAKKELLTQVALLLKRVPNLATLAYNDGTPFADPQTRMWLEAEVLPVLGSGDGGGGGGAAAPSVLDEPMKEARELAVKGELAKAIDVVNKAASAAPTPADRFRGKLAIAQLCLGAGQFSIARGQLEGLTEVVDRHQLHHWDPAICAEVYGALFTAHKGLNSGAMITPEQKAAEDAVFEKLCQLDPAAALKLGGDKAG